MKEQETEIILKFNHNVQTKKYIKNMQVKKVIIALKYKRNIGCI